MAAMGLWTVINESDSPYLMRTADIRNCFGLRRDLKVHRSSAKSRAYGVRVRRRTFAGSLSGRPGLAIRRAALKVALEVYMHLESINMQITVQWRFSTRKRDLGLSHTFRHATH